MSPGFGHAPGVLCLVHGIRLSWCRMDNGRIVRIVAFGGYSRTRAKEPRWVIEAVNPLGPFHAISVVTGEPTLREVLSARQRFLMPLGPDDAFGEEEKTVEELILAQLLELAE